MSKSKRKVRVWMSHSLCYLWRMCLFSFGITRKILEIWEICRVIVMKLPWFIIFCLIILVMEENIFRNVIYIEWKFCVILWKWFWCNFQWLNEFYMPQVFLWAGKKHTQICRLFIGIVSSIFLGNCKWKSFWGLMIFHINFYNRFLKHKYID